MIALVLDISVFQQVFCDVIEIVSRSALMGK